jgi:hypothetical protein
MTAFNWAQVFTIGLFILTWSLVTLFGKTMPSGSALSLGFLIAWVGMNFLPKIF